MDVGGWTGTGAMCRNEYQRPKIGFSFHLVYFYRWA